MNENDTTPRTANEPAGTDIGSSADDTRPGLDVPDTQPVTSSGATVTYPTLPPQFTLDDGPAAVPAQPADPADPADPAGQPAPADPVAPAARRSLRVRTVVFGLVMLAISVVSLVALTTDVHVDGGVVGLGLLIGAGAALVAGGIAAAMREARGGPGAAH